RRRGRLVRVHQLHTADEGDHDQGAHGAASYSPARARHPVSNGRSTTGMRGACIAFMALTGRAEAIARGKSFRDQIPRASHASWPALADRPNPLDLLEQSHQRRLPHLAPIRWGRMVGSPFAYLRGSAMVMAWDLAHLPHSELY